MRNAEYNLLLEGTVDGDLNISGIIPEASESGRMYRQVIGRTRKSEIIEIQLNRLIIANHWLNWETKEFVYANELSGGEQ